jgi:hypothetical protein
VNIGSCISLFELRLRWIGRGCNAVAASTYSHDLLRCCWPDNLAFIFYLTASRGTPQMGSFFLLFARSTIKDADYIRRHSVQTSSTLWSGGYRDCCDDFSSELGCFYRGQYIDVLVYYFLCIHFVFCQVPLTESYGDGHTNQ